MYLYNIHVKIKRIEKIEEIRTTAGVASINEKIIELSETECHVERKTVKKI